MCANLSETTDLFMIIKKTLNSKLHFLCNECKHRENEPRMNIAVLYVIICAGYLIEALT